jgi:hypothetical protein
MTSLRVLESELLRLVEQALKKWAMPVLPRIVAGLAKVPIGGSTMVTSLVIPFSWLLKRWAGPSMSVI